MASLAEGAEDFSSHLALGRGLAPKTVEAYGRDIRRFNAFLVRRGVADCAAITRAHVLAYADDLLAAGLKATSRARAMIAVRLFCRHLAARAYVRTDPAQLVDSPKRGQTLPKILSRDVVVRLVTSVDGDDPRDVRDRAILELLYGCGLRVSELCAMQVSDFLRDDDLVRCRGKGSKDRVVPLGRKTGQALARWLDEGRVRFVRPRSPDLLFLQRLGGGFTRMGVFKLLKQRAAAAGIDPAIVSPHVLRHCFASHLLDGGADVLSIKEMLGHASVATTQIYTHVDRSRFAEIHRKHHPRA